LGNQGLSGAVRGAFFKGVFDGIWESKTHIFQ
jgi:hypothetical protein